MVKILMLDLGETLVHGTESLFPHVPEALEAFGQFRAADGDPLATCLVSDFGPADPRPTPEQVETAFREYVSLLERLHLKHFFEPVSRHVTLSVQVGVRKPDRRIFEAAIRRLGLSAELSDCLFITEDAGHVAACRNLGMQTLRFGAAGGPGVVFQDWSEALLLVARLVGHPSVANLKLALELRLNVSHELELTSIRDIDPSGRIVAWANRWTPVPVSRSDRSKTIEVPIPVEVEVHLDPVGRIRTLSVSEPDPEAIEEATIHLETLEANHRIMHGAGPLTGDATHRVETDASGQRRLKRERFTTA